MRVLGGMFLTRVYSGKYLRFFVCVLTVLSVSMVSCADQKRVFTIHDGDDLRLCAEQVLPSSLPLIKYTYKSDVPFAREEFEHILASSINSNSTNRSIGNSTAKSIVKSISKSIDAQKLECALYRLFAKKKFEAISVTSELEGEDQGIGLHFEFISQWMLKRIDVSGIFWGRATYAQHYLLRVGDHFDLEKHQRSLEKITNTLHGEGYFCAKVTSSLVRNLIKKEIIVKIIIDRGSQSIIDKIKINFVGDDGVSSEQKDGLEKQLIKKFIKRIVRGRYRKNMIEQIVSEIREYIILAGFPYVTILTEESIDSQKGTASLDLNIDLHRWQPIAFRGNSYWSSAQLLEKLASFGRSAWLIPSTVLSAEIERLYKDKGFWQVKVTVEDEDGHRILHVDEGKESRIGRVSFRNNSHFSSSYILEYSFKHSLKYNYKHMPKHRHSNRFNQNEIDDALVSIINLYQNAGFLDASIVDSVFNASSRDGVYELE